jgi:hypothetical protein
MEFAFMKLYREAESGHELAKDAGKARHVTFGHPKGGRIPHGEA